MKLRGRGWKVSVSLIPGLVDYRELKCTKCFPMHRYAKQTKVIAPCFKQVNGVQ